ncbi:TPA: AAA family ATPase [Enterococcus faecalis]|nr:AAA family ATPase [Enterococcus faecalis]HAP3007028.1 AAA family ATPase [Enterococcus faecalis]
MKFESITIKNFRNFKNITVKLGNKNIFFGLNNVGKTNFLYAFRFVFDKEIRKNNLIDSDFHQRKCDDPIEIIVKIDISDVGCTDNQKLRAKLRGALLSEHKKVYIKLFAEYNQNEMMAMPIMSWGGSLDSLQEMKPRGYMYEVDYIMNVIYIDSYVDLNKLFKKNVAHLIKNDEEEDSAILDEISKTVESLNTKISSLSGVKDFENKITPEYQKFRDDDVSVSVKSEIAIKGLYSNVIPYIKNGNNDELYPTSGEGRKKLLAYSIYELIAKENSERKINLFLIEEPENHLHKSMQIALSQILFNDEKYKYLFLSTHSPYILNEMDKVNLVRIYNESKIDSTSQFYEVPKKFSTNKKLLNKGLSEAIFSDTVLLIEGPSEQMLFEKVLSVVNPQYEAEGIYILSVNGVGFKSYVDILKGLSIKTFIKTDNDLRKVEKTEDYSVLGFSRINSYVEDEYKLPVKRIKINSVSSKRNLYRENKDNLDNIRDEYNIYLSKCDLENDLDEFLHQELSEILNTDNVVKYLQDSKHYHMVELVEKISDEDCRKITDHYNFSFFKEISK